MAPDGLSEFSMHQAFVSWSNYSTLLNDQGECDSYESQLKLACVLYDAVILPGSTEDVEGLIDRLASEQRLQTSDLQRVFRSEAPALQQVPETVDLEFWGKEVDSFADNRKALWRSFNKALMDELREEGRLTKYGLRKFMREHALFFGRDFAVAQLTALRTAYCWQVASAATGCAVVSFNRSTMIAARYVTQRLPVPYFKSVFSELEFLVPSVSLLRWEDVLHLRNEPSIRSFRDYIHRKIWCEDRADELAKDIISDLWNALRMLKLSPGAEIAKGFFGNLPMPIPWLPNPVSIYSSVVSSKNAVLLAMKYKPLLFMECLTRTTRRSNNSED